MGKRKTLYVANRNDWLAWLVEHFDKEDEIWLVYPQKPSGKPRISYNDAVEEALCFGWIDSTIKTIDEDNNAQRFLPRNPQSNFSQANKERLKWLLKENMLHPSMQDIAKKVFKEKFVFPPDLILWEQ